MTFTAETETGVTGTVLHENAAVAFAGHQMQIVDVFAVHDRSVAVAGLDFDCEIYGCVNVSDAYQRNHRHQKFFDDKGVIGRCFAENNTGFLGDAHADFGHDDRGVATDEIAVGRTGFMVETDFFELLNLTG